LLGGEIAEYVSSVKKIVSELDRLNGMLAEKLVVKQLVNNLPCQYEGLKTAIDLMDGVSVEKYLHALQKTHKRLATQTDHSVDTALFVKRKGSRFEGTRKPRVCWVCGKHDHMCRDCPDRMDRVVDRSVGKASHVKVKPMKPFGWHDSDGHFISC